MRGRERTAPHRPPPPPPPPPHLQPAGIGNVARPPEPRRRLGLTLPEAAASIGVSLTTFRNRVLPTLKTVKLGRAIVVRPDELDAWLEQQGTLNTPYN